MVTLWAPAVASAATGDTLRSGHELASGEILQSGQVVLTMTTGGDLQLQVGPAVTWSTGSGGHAGATLSMQTDGNLVLRSASGAAVWATWTQGHSGASAAVLSTGVLEVLSSGGDVLWWSGSLQGGQVLGVGRVLTAPAGRMALVMQTDGNLVLRKNGAAVWASWTQGHPGAAATMQGDGNLVVRGTDGRALWASWTQGHSGASLWVQDNGLLVLYSPSRSPLWLQDKTLTSQLCALIGTDPAGTAITRWNPVVRCVLAMLGQSAAEASDVDIVIQYESGGDPDAINDYDINAQRGHPSIGLVQVIKPTFEEWRSPVLPDSQYDPAANIYAGMNYAIHRYGSIHNIPGLVSLRNGGGYKGYIVGS